MSVVTDTKAAALGTRRTCRSCGASFYDLRKEPPVCPKCQTVFDVDAIPELPPLAPEDEDATSAKKKARKKKRSSTHDDRASYDSGDDGASDPDADW
jgi:uncharacterized protein (TIGR02300 family)